MTHITHKLQAAGIMSVGERDSIIDKEFEGRVTTESIRRARKFTTHKTRNFDAAQLTRLTDSWTTSPKSIDQILEKDLRILRARSREQTRNNDYAKKFITMLKANVIGPDGVGFQARTKSNKGKPNTPLNESIETQWKQFSRKGECEVTGQMTMIDAACAFVSTVAIDGEVILIHVPWYENLSNYAFQFIDPEALDVQYNRILANGNKIRMGVELNGYRKPVAYHFTVEDTRDRDYTFQGRSYKRVDASNVIHEFLPEYLNQTRGFPWMSTALMRMQMLNGYEESAVVASRVGASKMGVYTTPSGDGYTGDGTDAQGNTLTDADPGTFEQLPEGSELMSWDPKYPHEQFASFVKACLRGIGAGLGVSYNGLANDLEGVNFSSIRTGVLEEREVWKGLQRWVIDSFYSPVYMKWIEYQVRTGAIKINGQPIQENRLPQCCEVSWQGRRWAWVDPLKDMQANTTAIEQGITTISAVIRESGKDPEEVWQERKREKERMEELGITPEPAKAGFLTPGEDDDDEEDKK